jgi:hypothetical protein
MLLGTSINFKESENIFSQTIFDKKEEYKGKKSIFSKRE